MLSFDHCQLLYTLLPFLLNLDYTVVFSFSDDYSTPSPIFKLNYYSITPTSLEKQALGKFSELNTQYIINPALQYLDLHPGQPGHRLGSFLIEGAELGAVGKTISGASKLNNRPSVLFMESEVGPSVIKDKIPSQTPGAVKFIKEGNLGHVEDIGPHSKIVLSREQQLKRKYKHAEVFGIKGNYNPENGKKFYLAVQKHLNDPKVKEINGTFRGNEVIFHVNPDTSIAVIQKLNGEFVSAWKLKNDQLNNILKRNKL